MSRILHKRRFMIILISVLLVFVLIVVCNVLVARKSTKYCFDNTDDIPYSPVGLLLGTTPMLSNGRVNLYFKYRIDAALELYHAGKIKYLLVSGDNSRNEYNEPQEMKNALIAGGIPQNRVFLDYAGFRTLDSVVRAKEIFGQDTFTVISHKFHNERAIYLARHYDIEALGFNAQDVSVHYGFKTRVREWLARVKVFVDLLTNKQPKFLGEPIEIPE